MRLNMKDNKKDGGDLDLVLFLLFLTLCSGFVLASRVVSASDVIDDFSININVSCTLFNNVGTPHTAEVPNGTYETDIGTTTIKAYCNDTNGFSIYAIGYTGEEYGNNTLVGTDNSSSTIVTGTATSGQTSNWAMKLGAVSGTYTPTILNSFDSYHAVPSTYTQVAKYASGTDVGTTMANANGSSITTTYASYISYTQAADTYEGKVKYTLVHPNDAEIPLSPQTTQAGQICYYPNGSNVEGTMGCQTIPASGTTDGVSPTSATLLASNFSRAGYGFAGWSTTFDYSDSTGFLGPQEYIEFTEGAYSGNNRGLSLYAHWIESAGDLQGWTGCSSLASGAVTALTDQRDNETYAVAKLADGNCWMIENLRLESTAAHNSDGTLAQGYGVSSTYGNFSGLADDESANFDDVTSANSLYYASDQSGTSSVDISNGDYPGCRMPRYNNVNTSTYSLSPTSNNSSIWLYGNYYTWSAAIANTIYYDDPIATDANGKTSETVGTSICPSGWRLPYGRTIGNGSLSGGFYYLNYKINNNSNITDSTASRRLRSFPNNFVFSGGFDTSYAFDRGNSGFYWSSTAGDYFASYGLYLNSFAVNPGTDYNTKYYGGSIRCNLGS